MEANPPEEVELDTENSDPGKKWVLVQKGPNGSPFSHGKFAIDFHFENYPFKAPKVFFKTKIYHPNIDENGEICANIYENDWSPTKNVKSILDIIKTLLINPDPTNPLSVEIGTEFLENYSQYEKTAAEWTKQYAMAQETSQGKLEKPYKSSILFHNISKRKNFGDIILNGTTLGVDKFYLINKTQDQISKSKVFQQLNRQGNHLISKIDKIDYEVFPSLKEAKEYFNANGITICGIEITDQSQNVEQHPFKGDTVFIPGNEYTGLTAQLKEICDDFVYIPQNSDKTASLNVAIATSIVQHHFAVWADFPEYENEQIEEIEDLDEVVNKGQEIL